MTKETEYEIHTRGARHSFEPRDDRCDPERNKPLSYTDKRAGDVAMTLKYVFLDCNSAYFAVQDGQRSSHYGSRLLDDRRFWMAWQDAELNPATDMWRGVMDDYGSLVETRL